MCTTVACAFPTLQKAPAEGGRAARWWWAIPCARRSARWPTSPTSPPEPNGPIRLLVTGGSQGARLLSELVPEAVAKALPEELRKRLNVQQQTRAGVHEHARRRIYADALVDAEIAPFFRDMATRLRDAHLVIGRSGAGTGLRVRRGRQAGHPDPAGHRPRRRPGPERPAAGRGRRRARWPARASSPSRPWPTP